MFNFDDLPDYEPLEVVLAMLRQKETVLQGLDKLLVVRIYNLSVLDRHSSSSNLYDQVEMDELFDHPQWQELLVLIDSALADSAASADVAVQVLSAALLL